jgi:membrane protein implicated in regulation of membrane protease activity
MSAQFFIHAFFLSAAVLLTYFWTANPSFEPYTLQLMAVLVIFYFLNHLWQNPKYRLTLAIDGLIFAMVTLLLIQQTGSLSSPLFFLIYILLFGLSLLLNPIITLFFSLLLVAFFLPQTTNLNNVLQLIGLLLITPLALFFGRQYLQILESEKKIKILNINRQALEREVCQQEEDTLLWLSLAFKEQIVNILDHSSNLLSDIGRLTQSQRERLQTIHESAKQLLQLGDKLKEKIEG